MSNLQSLNKNLASRLNLDIRLNFSLVFASFTKNNEVVVIQNRKNES